MGAERMPKPVGPSPPDVMIPIDYRDDWHGTERIMTEEAQRVSSAAEAAQAIAHMI